MKYLPIKFHAVYIVSTLLFSFFGPREYDDYNMEYAAFFMFLYLMIVIVGFSFGLRLKSTSLKIKSVIKPYTLFKFSLIFILLAYSYNLYHLHTTGALNLNISEVGENYVKFYKNYKKGNASIFTYEILFLVIVAIPKFIILALGFFYFRKLTALYRVLLVTCILMILLSHTIAMGNQKSIGDIVIFGMIALMVFASRLSRTKRTIVFRRGALLMALFFVFLSYSQYSRFGDAKGLTVQQFNKIMHSYSRYKPDHLIFKTLGVPAGLGVSHFITGYLSGGYYGLSKTLELPFVWTYGLGSSVGVSTIIKNISGKDPYEKTYLHRMEKKYNIPGKKHWNSIFPWLASDLTFGGTLFFFFMVSLVYGFTWKEVLIYKNVVSLLLFSLLTIMFVFVPANNQIFHGFDYILISLFVFFYWLIYHNKYNILPSHFNSLSEQNKVK